MATCLRQYSASFCCEGKTPSICKRLCFHFFFSRSDCGFFQNVRSWEGKWIFPWGVVLECPVYWLLSTCTSMSQHVQIVCVCVCVCSTRWKLECLLIIRVPRQWQGRGWKSRVEKDFVVCLFLLCLFVVCLLMPRIFSDCSLSRAFFEFQEKFCCSLY